MSTNSSVAKSVKGRKALRALGVACGVLLLIYVFFMRPFFSPRPLTQVVPDDVALYASVDLVNAGRTGFDFVNTIGLRRFLKLIEPEKKEEEKTDLPGAVIKNSWSWVTREIMVVMDTDDTGRQDMAIMVGSHSKRRAERNMPDILDALKNTQADGLMELDPVAEKALRELDVEKLFKKTRFRGVNIYCNNNPDTDAFLSGVCWASTRRALVITKSKKMAYRLIVSINGRRTAAQKQYMRVKQREVPPDYVVYAYANVEKNLHLMQEFDNPEYNIVRELRALDGAVYSLSFINLSPRHKLSVMVNKDALRRTKILKTFLAAAPGPHALDRQIKDENAISFMSLNNASMLAEYYTRDVLKKNKIEKIERRYHVDVDELVGAIGNEFAVALLDLKPVDDKKLAFTPEIIGAVEVKDRAVIVNALKKTMRSMDKKLKLYQRAGGIYEIELPEEQKLPNGLTPMIGFKGRYMYFSLNQDILRDYMNERRGSVSDGPSNLYVRNNPAFLARIIDARVENKQVSDLAVRVLSVLGPSSVSVGLTKDQLTVRATQRISPRGLHEMPLEKLLGKGEPAKPVVPDAEPLAKSVPRDTAAAVSVNVDNARNSVLKITRALFSKNSPMSLVSGITSIGGARAAAFGPRAVRPRRAPAVAGKLKPWKLYVEAFSEGMKSQFLGLRAPVEMLNVAGLTAQWFQTETMVTVSGKSTVEKPEFALIAGSSSEQTAAANIEKSIESINQTGVKIQKLKSTKRKKNPYIHKGVEVFRYRMLLDPDNKDSASEPFFITVLEDKVIISNSDRYAEELIDASAKRYVPADTLYSLVQGGNVAPTDISYTYVTGRMIDELTPMLRGAFEKKDAAAGGEAAPAEGEAAPADSEMVSSDTMAEEEFFEEPAVDTGGGELADTSGLEEEIPGPETLGATEEGTVEGVEEGIEEFVEEGTEEGVEEGTEEGVEEGTEEGAEEITEVTEEPQTGTLSGFKNGYDAGFLDAIAGKEAMFWEYDDQGDLIQDEGGEEPEAGDDDSSDEDSEDADESGDDESADEDMDSSESGEDAGEDTGEDTGDVELEPSPEAEKLFILGYKRAFDDVVVFDLIELEGEMYAETPLGVETYPEEATGTEEATATEEFPVEMPAEEVITEEYPAEEIPAEEMAPPPVPLKDRILAQLPYELKGLDGVMFSFGFKDVSPNYKITVFLNEENLKFTSVLKYFPLLRPDTHKVDGILSARKSIVKFSMNNFGKLLTRVYTGATNANFEQKQLDNVNAAFTENDINLDYVLEDMKFRDSGGLDAVLAHKDFFEGSLELDAEKMFTPDNRKKLVPVLGKFQTDPEGMLNDLIAFYKDMGIEDALGKDPENFPGMLLTAVYEYHFGLAVKDNLSKAARLAKKLDIELADIPYFKTRVESVAKTNEGLAKMDYDLAAFLGAFGGEVGVALFDLAMPAQTESAGVEEENGGAPATATLQTAALPVLPRFVAVVEVRDKAVILDTFKKIISRGNDSVIDKYNAENAPAEGMAAEEPAAETPAETPAAETPAEGTEAEAPADADAAVTDANKAKKKSGPAIKLEPLASKPAPDGALSQLTYLVEVVPGTLFVYKNSNVLLFIGFSRGYLFASMDLDLVMEFMDETGGKNGSERMSAGLSLNAGNARGFASTMFLAGLDNQLPQIQAVLEELFSRKKCTDREKFDIKQELSLIPLDEYLEMAIGRLCPGKKCTKADKERLNQHADRLRGFMRRTDDDLKPVKLNDSFKDVLKDVCRGDKKAKRKKCTPEQRSTVELYLKRVQKEMDYIDRAVKSESMEKTRPFVGGIVTGMCGAGRCSAARRVRMERQIKLIEFDLQRRLLDDYKTGMTEYVCAGDRCSDETMGGLANYVESIDKNVLELNKAEAELNRKMMAARQAPVLDALFDDFCARRACTGAARKRLLELGRQFVKPDDAEIIELNKRVRATRENYINRTMAEAFAGNACVEVTPYVDSMVREECPPGADPACTPEKKADIRDRAAKQLVKDVGNLRYDLKYIRKSRMQTLNDARMKFGVLDVFGGTTLRIAFSRNKGALELITGVREKGLAEFPFDSLFAMQKQGAVVANFATCMTAMEQVKGGMIAFGTTNYVLVDKYGDILSHILFKGSCDKPGACKGWVRAAMDAACEPGTFRLSTITKDDFVIKATSKGSECHICMSSYMNNWKSFAECKQGYKDYQCSLGN